MSSPFKLSIEVTKANGSFKLMVRHPSGHLAAAGMRLQTDEPIPVTVFDYSDFTQAMEAAAALQRYLERETKGRR